MSTLAGLLRLLETDGSFGPRRPCGPGLKLGLFQPVDQIRRRRQVVHYMMLRPDRALFLAPPASANHDPGAAQRLGGKHVAELVSHAVATLGGKAQLSGRGAMH